MGQWHSPDGRVYRERSQNIASLSLAKSMGRKLNQIAIWDNARHREIATGGTGK
jgi:hypothetical protein